MPNMRASPASTRWPAMPSGTRRVRRSTAPSLIVVVPAGSAPVEADATQRLDHDQRGSEVDAHVGDVEDRPVRELEEVDDMSAHRPGRAEEPIDQVAGDAG